jgi:hypothetical protein
VYRYDTDKCYAHVKENRERRARSGHNQRIKSAQGQSFNVLFISSKELTGSPDSLLIS